MADTHDLGPFFAHAIRLEHDAPLHHRAVTNEIDEPFRYSVSHVLHLWPGRGLVFGKWHHTDRTEDEALLDAIGLTTPDGTFGGREDVLRARPDWFGATASE